ncbi:HAD family hydrolase [Liquorilactobacillus satsumensis]|uniref:HAD superfamily hydrolase n=1 Tax=Liquorilactobacillus satsumensis DSM 16230 = JCM 12392 TaxID=1423801 RepID=A0A0R1V3H6_9LACO|nr:HAD family phosphatase [Liquorilactobacillus satsumensis]KRL97987.1 HAD superfamily hydrolase [Liquorilactobacillus satsumensis DSM 16230 = JCM 12392]MCC7667522.1 HAD family phosphatase [Liquorilactobacillus satsumensis]MCP9312348.1 HAD family phosphatase [Liquorilactobacillus satsumensis]MCP9327677.1 HAD family phosphatase [Liquorilactobacillus satsumensis]MCP9357052.1 HAD family phosphatase [Liquorilactobacillus satsumensis]
MNLDLVIFDMDGLVVDSEKIYYAANQRAADELKMNYSLAYYRQYIGTGTQKMINAMTRDYGSRSLVEQFIDLSHEFVFDVIKENGLPLKKGFLELSTFLAHHGVRKALASSNDRTAIDFFLQAAKIDNQFEYIVSADDVQHSKPDPDIFERAWTLAGTPAKQKALVLEDSFNGIKAAFNARIPSIMVPDLMPATAEVSAQTLAVLPNLAEVKTFIQK